MLHERGIQFIESLKGKEVILNGWRAAGLAESLLQTREKNNNSVNLNPFSKRKTDIVDKYLIFWTASRSWFSLSITT